MSHISHACAGISDKLARMIQIGLLEPGELLPGERVLADAFDVPRRTIRGALVALRERAMVAVHHGAHTRVVGSGALARAGEPLALKSLDVRTLHEACVVRTAIESQIGRLASQSISVATLDRLEALIEQQRAVRHNLAWYYVLDLEFHRLIDRACGVTLLADMAEDVYAVGLRQRRGLIGQVGAIERSLQQHCDIVRSLRARDAARSAEALRVHTARFEFQAPEILPAPPAQHRAMPSVISRDMGWLPPALAWTAREVPADNQ